MEKVATSIEGLFILKPRVFGDGRGYFYESFNQQKHNELELSYQFVQDNVSRSSYGVLRGLHFQKPPHDQAKLVSVLKGKVLDVVVDIRKASKTYGAYLSIELSDENHFQLMIPRGFAHGFSVLEEDTIFSYKVDNLYHPGSECGIQFNDPALNIKWQIPENKIQLSPKDMENPSFADLVSPFE
ncbi:UNVERIFIED_CONTAM: hypothetical protein GTU68_036030 [Idotea baltica]|nr:hypothetical protein [Idotea baltica]